MTLQKLNKEIIHLNDAPASWQVKKLLTVLLKGLRTGGWISKNVSVVLHVSFVSSGQMAKLNKKYRRKNKPTDVLSFEQPGAYSQNQILFLGDLVLCREVVKKQAKERRHGVRCEVAILLVHGIFHLLGFDHETSVKDANKMAKAEQELLRITGILGQHRSKAGLIHLTEVEKFHV